MFRIFIRHIIELGRVNKQFQKNHGKRLKVFHKHNTALHQQFKDHFLHLEITKQNSKAWRNAPFFQRLAAIRKVAFLQALEFFENFCDTNVTTQNFAEFLKQAHANYGNACSGDILDQGMAFTARSEIPLLLTDAGVIKTEPSVIPLSNNPIKNLNSRTLSIFSCRDFEGLFAVLNNIRVVTIGLFV